MSGNPSREYISSGSIILDRALGSWGLPRGSICEISGPIGSGKTTICLAAIADAQETGLLSAIIDVDLSLDIRYAQRCGVNPDKLIVAQPQYAEEALDIAMRLIRSSCFGLVVLDSINTLNPRDEENPTARNAFASEINKLLSNFLRRIKLPLKNAKSVLIATNNPPPKSKIVYHRLKQNPQRVALQNHAAVRIKLSPSQTISRDGLIVGQQVKAKIVKNITPCYDYIELDIMYNLGLSRLGELFDLGVELNKIERHGQEYYFRDLALGPGRISAIESIRNNLPIAEELEQVIRQP
jgi:recombination protein RecA